MVVLGGTASDTLTGSAGVDLLAGGAGDDTFIGGVGNDTLIGGETGETQGDKAVYNAAIDATGISDTGSGWTVTSDTEGTDTLTEIEIVDGTESGKFLLVGNGGFTTIQDAVNAAGDGDTILLAAGAFVGDVTVNKAVTILGANQGIDGTGVRGAESIIQGTVTVTQATDNVAFDGVQINNTSDNLTQFKGIVVSGGADVTVENSWFHSTGPNGNNVNGDRGIELQSGATGTILIDGNLFGGVQDGAGNRFSTANWTTGVWSDGNSVGLTITGNTFDSVRTGLNLDGYNDATTNVSLNSFVESGSGISIGTPSGSVVTGIHNNAFDGVGSGFNLLNVATSQSLDLNATSNVSVSPTDAMVVLGGTASDTLTGSDGVDSLGHRLGRHAVVRRRGRQRSVRCLRREDRGYVTFERDHGLRPESTADQL